MPNYCYFNGKIIPENEAHLSLNDLGVLRGYGVFDMLRTYQGKPFLLEEHLNRFQHSAAVVGLKVPLSNVEMKKIIVELIQKNHLEEAVAKLVLTGGESPDGINYDIDSPTFFIVVKKIPHHAEAIYQNGVKLITHDYQRNYPVAKTTDYLSLMQFQKQRKALGAYDVLYFHKGLITEGATCSIFFLKGNQLITPKNNILLGITQKFVIDLAQHNYFQIEVRDVALSELPNMSEVFIASTTREIVPVVEIDDLKFGNGQVGNKTKQLMQLFRERAIALSN